MDLFPEDVPESLSAVDPISLGDNETDNGIPQGSVSNCFFVFNFASGINYFCTAEPRSVKSRLHVWIPILAAVLVASLLSFAFVVSFVCKSKYGDRDLLVPKSSSVNCSI